MEDPKKLVRESYDRISQAYRGDDEPPDRYLSWLGELTPTLAPGAAVLDVGCGNGVPSCRWLVEQGFVVTGIDFSTTQISRALRLVPGATFLELDMTEAAFDDSSFDGILALYSTIHVPVDEQPALFERMGSWLRPGGHLLTMIGTSAGTSTEEDWLGAPMYWSQASPEDSLSWIREGGLQIRSTREIPDWLSDETHLLVLAQRP